MIKISRRTLPAVLVLAFASAGLSAMAQSTTEPTMTQKAENTGKEAWDATKSGTKKAVDATEHAGEQAWDSTKKGSKKAWNATKHGTKKAVEGTEHAAHATGKAVSDAGSAAADATRKTGDKIGEYVPGTPQHDAKKP